jgi:hydrogenase maturation protease
LPIFPDPLQTAEPTSSITIAGVGNPHIAQDTIGERVLSRLRSVAPEEVQLIDLGSNSLALLDYMCRQTLLLVIDASASGICSDNVEVFRENFEDLARPSGGSHQVGLIETLTIAKRLFPEKFPDHTVLILADTDAIELQAYDTVCDRIVDIVKEELSSFYRRIIT